MLWVRSLYTLDAVSRINDDGGGRRVISHRRHRSLRGRFAIDVPGGDSLGVVADSRASTDWGWLYPSAANPPAGSGRLLRCGGGLRGPGPAWVLYRVTVVPDWAAAMACSVLPATLVPAQIGGAQSGIRTAILPLLWLRPQATPGRCPECGATPGQSPSGAQISRNFKLTHYPLFRRFDCPAAGWVGSAGPQIHSRPPRRRGARWP